MINFKKNKTGGLILSNLKTYEKTIRKCDTGISIDIQINEIELRFKNKPLSLQPINFQQSYVNKPLEKEKSFQ